MSKAPSVTVDPREDLEEVLAYDIDVPTSLPHPDRSLEQTERLCEYLAQLVEEVRAKLAHFPRESALRRRIQVTLGEADVRLTAPAARRAPVAAAARAVHTGLLVQAVLRASTELDEATAHGEHTRTARPPQRPTE
ncbi:DUF6415 family natural product biosynthesis protein [Streptomyces sp. NBC_01304]|uniref:DUF6415 family natural product biosynthesis protein n=1 Tax=Streptomyces sp. NBC_01304 TaxID=2903818 RepID=UPI002E13CB9B|nr:DUF6415 family natural product biosynthesis protein [Streptomyces sp. NBC_01304]